MGRKAITSVLGRLALIIASFVLALVLIEVAARGFVAFVKPNVMLLDPVLGWAHRPNAKRTYYIEGHPAVVETNELGLRSDLGSTSPGVTRILVLGDSFVDGMEVSNHDLFSEVLDELRPDLEVVNAGVGGYGTVQQFLYLKRLQPVVGADKCILMTFENDLTDNITPILDGIGPRPFLDENGRIQPLEWATFAPLLLPVPGAKWLHRHSVAAYLFRNRVWARVIGGDSDLYVEGLRAAFSEDDQWRLYESLVSRMRDLCPLSIVAVPRKEYVRSQDKEFGHRLKQAAEAVGVSFVDLLDDLRPEHFYEEDIHWNVDGHRTVAETLGRQIPKNGWEAS